MADDMVMSPVIVPPARGSFVESAVAVKAAPLARSKNKQNQFPEPSDMNIARSFAAVVIFAALGRIRDVALCVSVKAPVNLTILQIPSATVPSPVIVVVPVIWIYLPVAAPIFVVVAEAISAPFASPWRRMDWMACKKFSITEGDSLSAGELLAAVTLRSDIKVGTAMRYSPWFPVAPIPPAITGA